MIGELSLLLAGAVLAVVDLPRDDASGPPGPSQIAGRMGGVASSLHDVLTGEPVQNQQKRIVRDLDALIAALEKECAGCRNGIKKNNPNRGMADSTISGGTGGAGPMKNVGDGGKDWANLSERERDRILQSMSEGFPPEYRTVLERYYRRLAEEKSAPSPGTPTDNRPSAPASSAPAE